MAESCSGCGSDLFPGQKFCRVCGRRTGDLLGVDPPTQMMSPAEAGESRTQMMPPPPGGAQTGRVQSDTSPTGRQPTAQGYQPSVADYYQPMMRTQAPVYLPPKKRSPWGWIFAFIGIGVFGFMVIAILIAVRGARSGSSFARFPHSESSGSTQPMAGEVALTDNEASTQVGDEETTITKTFPITSTASFSISNVSGDVQIEGWDQPNAEVKVIKSGGSTEGRREAKVYYVADAGRVAFRTPRNPRGVTVRYEVKLPHQLGAVKIHSVSSDVRLTGVAGDLSVETTSGEINLSGISGSANVASVSGEINAGFDKQAANKNLNFTSVSGGINLTFKSDLNATLAANTVSGDISIDKAYGINVQEQIAHKQASGTIGIGGSSLGVNTVSGDISIKKAEQ